MRDFFEVFLRYLLGWLAVFLILCIISVIKYWDVLTTALSNNVESMVSGLFTILIVVVGIIWLLRAIVS